jgi:hypothetical protein
MTDTIDTPAHPHSRSRRRSDRIQTTFHSGMKNIQTALAIGLVIFAGASYSAANPTPTVEFSFSVNEKLPKDARVTRIGDGPCGMYVDARVSKMPNLDSNEYLIPDKVVEVDGKNRILRRWAKPLDDELVGIRGDRILIRTGEKLYWFERSGNFQLQSQPLALAEPKFLRRIKQHPEFKNSGYAGIWSYKDLRTRKVRRIIYEAPCT